MRSGLAAVALFLAAPRAAADDWPTAGGDARRSGYTAQALPEKPALLWTYEAPHPPMPAWPASDRLVFDRSYVPVVAGGMLCFGSSADGKIYALDAATGRESWSVFTGGPVRFAPAAWKDRLFAVSDDGHLYCLKTATGEVLWKYRAGPDASKVLGNERLISRWPARGGPVVADDVVYFAAGVWPSEGVYVCALEAATGKVLWTNDRSGSISMGQPHGGANAVSGVAAQGDLLVAGDLLLVPTGRAVPAAFQRSDGTFKYFHLQQNGQRGGSATLSVGSHFFNGGMLFDVATGAQHEQVGPGALAVLPEGIVRSTDKELVAAKFVDKEKRDKKGDLVRHKGLEKLWSLPDVPGGKAVIVAGRSIVVAGAKEVAVVNADARQVEWSSEVQGTPHGLAAAGGRLYVSTDRGIIHCFASKRDAAPALLKAQRKELPYGEGGVWAEAAKEILEKTGVSEGFCVDLECGDGALAFELARRTKLQIFAFDPDAGKVALARRRLDEAGLYGVRVTVHPSAPDAVPRGFADLVVSGRSAVEGRAAVPKEAALRPLRPFGGVACVGKPGAMEKTVRGALAGSGRWTHQYADPANSGCSADDVVKGPLSMLWFRDSDYPVPQRHGRGPAPLVWEGRLIVEGLNGVRAVDAYNGRTLWEFSLPQILKSLQGEHLMGTSGTGSNVCVTADGVYLRSGSRCLRLDLATGRKLAEFEAPALPGGKAGRWGYIACENGTLYGSIANEEHVVKWRFGSAQASDMTEQFTESTGIFALDAIMGRPKWIHPARFSIRHNAIAVAGGRVFLIDRPRAEGDRIFEKNERLPHPGGELMALDAATGDVLWRSSEEVFGTLLVASVKHDALLMGYQPTRFKLPSETGGRLAVLRASDGKRLWDKKAVYGTRPVVNDRMIYAQGGAWELLTGDERTFDLKRSYGCGQLASSTHLVVYRSATLGYHDLQKPDATTSYGGIRPGCWINAIPAGGLVLVPDATQGCKCSYLNQAWIALQPRE
jgi:outer membrane protein assembly factor BamB